MTLAREPWVDYRNDQLAIGDIVVDERGDVYRFDGWMWTTGDTGAGYQLRARRGYWNVVGERQALRHYHTVKLHVRPERGLDFELGLITRGCTTAAARRIALRT